MHIRFCLFLNLLALGAGCGRQGGSSGSGPVCSLRACDSIGMEIGDENLLFGNISDACYLQDGRIAVVDRVFNDVRVFTGTGDFITRIAATGSGPREFLSPLFVSPRGSGLMLCSIMGMKEIYYDSSFNCLGEVQFTDPNIRPGCPVRIQAVDDSLYIGDTFFITVQKSGDYEGGTELSLWDGTERIRTYRTRTAEEFNQLTFQVDARIHSCFDTVTGRLYWADAASDEYSVNCVDVYADSGWIFVDREWEPVPKPDSVIQGEREMYIRSWNEGTGHDPDFDFTVNAFYNAIEGIGVDSLGRVWIRTGLERSSEFHVYEPDGTFLFECVFETPAFQDCDMWDVLVCRQGFLAFPRNPELFPKVYMLEMISE